MSMLSKVLVFGLACVFAEDDLVARFNSEDGNYFVLNFNNNEFPAATDRCVPFSILGGPHQMATCVDANTVTYATYTDETCGTMTSQLTYNETTQNGEGTLYDFRCDGSDAYASIEFGLACDSNTKVTMDAAVSACALTTDLGTDVAGAISINIYCESSPNYAELQYYDSPGATVADCDQADLYEIATAEDSCDFILETGGNMIYGETIACTASAVGSDDDSANTLNVISAFIVATILAIFTM